MKQLNMTLLLLGLTVSITGCAGAMSREEPIQPTWFEQCVQRAADLDRSLPASSRDKILAHIDHCQRGPVTAEESTRLNVAKAIYAWETQHANAFAEAVDALDGASLIATGPDGEAVDMVERLKRIRGLRTSPGMSRQARELINAARTQGTYFD